MAEKPQDYITLEGRQTTNAVEGFHGLALMYRDKRIDLQHNHYCAKTNMSICHKVSVNYNSLHKINYTSIQISTFDMLCRTWVQSGKYSAS